MTRITYNPKQCGGKPSIRGMRIRVSDVLQMQGEGISSEKILQDFPDLEAQDIQACLLYASHTIYHSYALRGNAFCNAPALRDAERHRGIPTLERGND
jgi:uncharacterized protein (DUF433 family)